MSKINKYDYVNIGAIVATVIGLAVETVGGAVLSRTTEIGFNLTKLHPLLFVGFAVTIAALIFAIIGNTVFGEKANGLISSTALYGAIAVVMLGTVIIALTITGPVLWPTNG